MHVYVHDLIVISLEKLSKFIIVVVLYSVHTSQNYIKFSITQYNLEPSLKSSFFRCKISKTGAISNH